MYAADHASASAGAGIAPDAQGLPLRLVADHWPLYAHPYVLGTALARVELYKRILDVEGCIIEAGVGWGGGLMLWQHLHYLLDPLALTRKIYGFDMFDEDNSFPVLSPQDQMGAPPETFPSNQAHLQDRLNAFAVSFQDSNLMTHLIAGNACETIPQWCAEKPHALVALLYLDFDVYAPTKIALEHLVPRMPKGALVVFDEANYGKWPGETVALREYFDLNKLRLRRFPYALTLAYAEIE